MACCDVGRPALNKGFGDVIVAAANDAEDLANAKANKRFGYFLKYTHLDTYLELSVGRFAARF
jgi:hypothetical protein